MMMKKSEQIHKNWNSAMITGNDDAGDAVSPDAADILSQARPKERRRFSHVIDVVP